MGHNHPKEEIYRGISTLDEPSAKWGWHGLSNRALQITGWISVLFLLAMIRGNHVGNIENWVLGVIAALIAVALLLKAFSPRGSQSRTVTAHNKPAGHVEPDWAADQVNGTGVYANLTDSQARAWNRVLDKKNEA